MNKSNKIQLFEDQPIRTTWDEEAEQLLRIIQSIPSPEAKRKFITYA